MADAAAEGGERPKKSRLILIAAGGALLLGGASFYAVWSGLVPLAGGKDAAQDEAKDTTSEGGGSLDRPYEGTPGVLPAFVAMAPLTISLGPDAGARHLKVAVTLEIDPARREGVEATLPRVADVLNTFLRAVEPEFLADPRRMARLRAQMLRRVQLVTPQGSVRDLLIQEFVLN